MNKEKLLKMSEKEIKIYVKHGEFEEDFKGPVDQALRALIAFLDKIYPSLEILTQVQLTVDLQKIIEQMKDIIAIAPNGPVILYKKQLGVKELIGLNLIGTFVGYKLNLLNEVSLSLDELVTLTGKTKGSISGILTGMVNDHLVEKPERGKYKISLLGIKCFLAEVFPKLKEETNALNDPIY